MKIFFLIIVSILFPIKSFAACGFHNITGYVWSGNTGWISLSCQNGAPLDYGISIDFASGQPQEDLSGYAWSSNMGWLNFDPVGPYPSYGGVQYGATFFRNTEVSATTTAGVVKGWAKWEALGEDGWMILGPIEISGTDYGVEIGADRLFSGWSWNGGDNIDADEEIERGDGWVLWDSTESMGGASVLAYWFETLYGSVYSGGDISAPFAPPINRYNATYLIQANGTIKPVFVTSESGTGAPYIFESSDYFELPDQENKYRGTLGWLDKAGMLAGRYGQVFNQIPSSQTVWLEGKVYHYEGDLNISSDITFMNDSGDGNGSGTIIVDGDLNINANLFYQTGSVAGVVQNLASVAWIVKGDVNIGSSVENVVGLFYSEGDISTGTTGSSLSDVPLKIEGMLIAKKINLQRIFIDETKEPAEKIIFDGRVIVNPPLGTSDIGKGLPVFSETFPE